MVIPDEFIKCVAFIGCKRNSGIAVGGTVFLVAVPIDNTEHAAGYAVTAKHVIEEIDKRDIDGKTHLRLNHKERGAEFVECGISQWVFPDDPHNDVAAAPFTWEITKYKHRAVPVKLFATQESVVAEGIGPGDNLFFPGLFVGMQGSTVNTPIVRVGSIAAMPDDHLSTRWGKLGPSYLAEVRSIGGHSGSPVFVSIEPGRMSAGGVSFDFARGINFWLLGMVHGHFIGTEELSQFGSFGDFLADGDRARSANAGVAIVIPAHNILEVLNKPELVEQREEMAKQLRG